MHQYLVILKYKNNPTTNIQFQQGSSGKACFCAMWHQLGWVDLGLEDKLGGWLTHVTGHLVLAVPGS